MAWRAARSLVVFHEQLKREHPRAAPPATPVEAWGLLGDTSHSSKSDHAAKDFPGWADNVVTAADWPDAPELGLDTWSVCEGLRESRDNRIKYVICDDQIFSSYPTSTRAAWAWGPYNPGDPNRDRHDTHAHLSVVGDARADDTRPWQTSPGGAGEGEDDMGASTPPITIEREGPTSLTIPPVQAGAADPRAAWLNVCNETFGVPYALRIWTTTGNGAWNALPGTNPDGAIALGSGQRFSRELPVGTAGVSIMRWAIDGDGALVEPSPEHPAHAGHLTLCFERGAVVRG